MNTAGGLNRPLFPQESRYMETAPQVHSRQPQSPQKRPRPLLGIRIPPPPRTRQRGRRRANRAKPKISFLCFPSPEIRTITVLRNSYNEKGREISGPSQRMDFKSTLCPENSGEAIPPKPAAITWLKFEQVPLPEISGTPASNLTHPLESTLSAWTFSTGLKLPHRKMVQVGPNLGRVTGGILRPSKMPVV